MDLWLISDPHLGHSNIIKYENRPFKTVEEWDEIFISNWNNKVQKHEKALILGDFSFYGKEKTKKIVKSLNGYISLLLGNHDRRKTYKWWLDTGFFRIYDYPIIIEDIIFSHEPILDVNFLNSYFLNIHGHLHSKIINSKRHRNVSVEITNYSPITLKQCLSNI